MGALLADRAGARGRRPSRAADRPNGRFNAIDRGGTFVARRIRYPAGERARWQVAVTTAANALRLTGSSRGPR